MYHCVAFWCKNNNAIFSVLDLRLLVGIFMEETHQQYAFIYMPCPQAGRYITSQCRTRSTSKCISTAKNKTAPSSAGNRKYKLTGSRLFCMVLHNLHLVLWGQCGLVTKTDLLSPSPPSLYNIRVTTKTAARSHNPALICLPYRKYHKLLSQHISATRHGVSLRRSEGKQAYMLRWVDAYVNRRVWAIVGYCVSTWCDYILNFVFERK